jgi:hypothetical protein
VGAAMIGGHRPELLQWLSSEVPFSFGIYALTVKNVKIIVHERKKDAYEKDTNLGLFHRVSLVKETQYYRRKFSFCHHVSMKPIPLGSRDGANISLDNKIALVMVCELHMPQPNT